MGVVSENESWVVQRGHVVIKKMARTGKDSLNDWERLLYCFWTADYMMRNAGDFANATAMYRDFQTDAVQYAKKLGLAKTLETFLLSQKNLEREYFKRFEAICNEIKSADPDNNT
jgi:hypothetical protein